MELNLVEIDAVQAAIPTVKEQVNQLTELELALVGGGPAT
jgi:hypothetical protein